MTSSPIPAARSQYLLDLLAQVPDPRKRRGRRHPLAGLLTVGIAAVIAGSRSFAAIGQWAADAGPEVLAVLGAARGPAALTLRELQRWLALAVACYHDEVHEALGRTPAAVWAGKVGETGPPATVASETAFLVDFLPVIRRTLSRSGFVIGHVQYYCDALKPWIARREQLGRFVLRRDPRDISRVWALDPDGGSYLEMGYRTLSRPPISAWEQKAAVDRLCELGRADVDESALFAMVEQMRQITDAAAAATRKARRDRERRAATSARAEPAMALPPDQDGTDAEARPFEVIEQW
jgi:putative transposase